MTTKLSEAQAAMLHEHALAWPGAIKWSIRLGSIQTWHVLCDRGYIVQGKITQEGRKALDEFDRKRK